MSRPPREERGPVRLCLAMFDLHRTLLSVRMSAAGWTIAMWPLRRVSLCRVEQLPVVRFSG
jgi:hypothetical protein